VVVDISEFEVLHHCSLKKWVEVGIGVGVGVEVEVEVEASAKWFCLWRFPVRFRLKIEISNTVWILAVEFER
jgi:hypothetical protein